ncbi:NirD/YgiW/YdeI family stress tolerance protein [Mesorhizobium sp. VNQ89]|uniref:YgiW/YdeI family stress tolerance OB fold protein n=1 Tax=Mesorhizobium quangtriensis TaxID=3157709 RepID=UPI0032B77A1F
MAVAFLSAFSAGAAQAQFAGSGGASVTTVQDARSARVGDRVELTGSIKKEVGRAQYLFRDKTGEIRVRIEKEFWRGREVTTKTELKLRGRVQSDVRGRFIDTYYFQIVN